MEEVIRVIKEKALRLLPDAIYLKRVYKRHMGKSLDLKNPKLFNEKLQWLKLYNRKPEYTTMVDKYAVKQYISDKIGVEYVIPTIGVWDDFDQIDFEALPNQFVLKCTHDSGGLVVCRDKSKLDMRAVREKLQTSLSNDFFYLGREWPYKDVPHKIIAEQYMADNYRDYKYFCMDSAPRMTLIYSEHFTKTGLKEVFYDESYKLQHSHRIEEILPIFPMIHPKQHHLMKQFAESLLRKISFSRIDYYEINEREYFAEITFFPESGFDEFNPQESDISFGHWKKLSQSGYKFYAEDCSIIIYDSYYNNKSHKSLVDYKFFCFNGVAESVMVCTDRDTGCPKFYFFDKKWNLKKYNIRGKEAPQGFTLPKPKSIDKMFSIAEKLSKGIPYVRVDLYSIDDLIYFGEMTFFPDSGFDKNLLQEADENWGEMLTLPKKQRV